MNNINHLKNHFVLILGLVSALYSLPASASVTDWSGPTPSEWSSRLADAEVQRLGDSLFYRGEDGAKWDYTSGLFAYALLKLDEHLGVARHQPFVEQLIGSFIQADGSIHRYQLETYNIDHVAPGKAVLRLYSLTGEERYRKAAALLRSQLDTHPRTGDGGFWHKKRYPWQMWLDGLYMGQPFYAEYACRFNQRAAFDDIAHQITTVARHTYNPATGLFYHGWDERKAQNWADKTTGCSSQFWGRAIGWYAMGIVDTLDYFPLDHPRRPELIAIFNQLADGVFRHADPETGLWFQVVDQGGREGNYLEATCAAMFIYSFAKGVNQGYLPASRTPAIRKAYASLIAKLVSTDKDGRTSLNQCCEVAGLSADRPGTYEYYVGERIVSNDLKGVGPFILAGIELDRLFGLEPTGWDKVPAILRRIVAPRFPARDFPITDFGAATDGTTDCTAAIARAIEACHQAGGGRVIVPRGLFITGAIHLKSHVNLHVSEGATLRFSTDPAHYLPVVLTRWEGVELMNYSPLIYAYGQENIAVTGKGTLDGAASFDNWWGWNIKAGKAGAPPLQSAARNRLVEMATANIPVAERIFGTGGYLRPNFIQPYRCKNVLVEGVTILRSPMWEIHPVLCTNVTVRDLKIISHGPNNDGCDPESSRDVLIENTFFDTGDDCIAIKSGRNADGRRLLMPAENIIIRNCHMKDGHGGTVIGSEISGGCRNVFTENCRMDSPELDHALRLKTNAERGAIIEEIHFRDVQVGRVAKSVCIVDFNYEEGSDGPWLPQVRNITIENVTGRSAPRVLNLQGFAHSPIRNVRLINCTFDGVEADDIVKNVEGLERINVKVGKKSQP